MAVQAIGFLGLIAFVISYQIRSNKALYICQFLGCGLFCLQMFLLGAASGSFSLMVNMLRSVLLIKYNDWPWVRKKWLAWVLCGMFALITAVTWAGPLSLLAFTASVVSTLCYWTNNARTIRLSNLLCASPCWLLYDFFVKSWGGMLNEAITIASILISIWRFGWKSLGEEEPLSRG